ncbi:hypothetical protein ACI6QG_10345 [Roseococcus sp. DSY-14]|uniref:hypothetical protein n=1 Tax=Roseococcus sp. DSY-14 TaxID=3369650 RepID=UPI00387B14C9
MGRRDRIRFSGPGLRALLRLARSWRLTSAQQCAALGGVAPATWLTWRMQARRGRVVILPEGVLLRLSVLLGVATALQVLCQDARESARWLRRRNRLQIRQGWAPIRVITSVSLDDLAHLRRGLGAMAAGRSIMDQRFDVSPPMVMLDSVGGRDATFAIPHGRGDEARTGSGPDMRTLRVPTRDSR